MKNARWFEATLVVLLIILTFTLYLFIVSTPSPAERWELNSTGNVDHMLIGDDDALYVFSDNNISAINRDGSLRWTLDVPGRWKVLNDWGVGLIPINGGSIGYSHSSYPVADVSAGRLYLYAFGRLTQADLDRANSDQYQTVFSQPSEIMAISPDGKIEWEYPLAINISSRDLVGLTRPDVYRQPAMPGVIERNGQVYVFYDRVEYVLDDRGKLLFRIDNVADLAAVDESGNIYLTKENVPSGTIESYDRTGNFRWSRDLEANISGQFSVWNEQGKYVSLPLYLNGSLYVPIDNGVAVLDTWGNLKWQKQLSGGRYAPFEVMPVDASGYVYFRKLSDDGLYEHSSAVRIIGPDGRELPQSWNFISPGSIDNPDNLPRLITGSEGIVFTTTGAYGRSLDEQEFSELIRTKRFEGDTIYAYDLKTGTALWNFTVPADDVHTLTYNQSNYPSNQWKSPGDPDIHEEAYFEYFGVSLEEVEIHYGASNNIRVTPGKNLTYVYFNSEMHSWPVIYNHSQALYARDLYAIDHQGKLLWKMPVDSYVINMAASNDTFYYSTSDGKIGGSGSIVAGVAFAAFAYLILRFFAVGAVSRARGQLDRNDNRNAVLRFIAGHPGQTARELSRSLGMNLGTLRYHLFILGANHKVVAHGDDKYRRYFPNSCNYTGPERDLLSLMRREPVRRTLEVLMENPGISGRGLSKKLNLSTTVTHKHVTLLVERGIVARILQIDRSYAYAIKDEYRQLVLKLAERL